jgi:hypothetical protein
LRAAVELARTPLASDGLSSGLSLSLASPQGASKSARTFPGERLTFSKDMNKMDT